MNPDVALVFQHLADMEYHTAPEIAEGLKEYPQCDAILGLFQPNSIR